MLIHEIDYENKKLIFSKNILLYPDFIKKSVCIFDGYLMTILDKYNISDECTFNIYNIHLYDFGAKIRMYNSDFYSIDLREYTYVENNTGALNKIKTVDQYGKVRYFDMNELNKFVYTITK